MWRRLRTIAAAFFEDFPDAFLTPFFAELTLTVVVLGLRPDVDAVGLIARTAAVDAVDLQAVRADRRVDVEAVAGIVY